MAGLRLLRAGRASAREAYSPFGRSGLGGGLRAVCVAIAVVRGRCAALLHDAAEALPFRVCWSHWSGGARFHWLRPMRRGCRCSCHLCSWACLGSSACRLLAGRRSANARCRLTWHRTAPGGAAACGGLARPARPRGLAIARMGGWAAEVGPGSGGFAGGSRLANARAGRARLTDLRSSDRSWQGEFDVWSFNNVLFVVPGSA